ncbi:septum formation initiator family protein [Corynebacterium riegelii]|uniref:septum formation initiator family protein n=1 Tax=Corynebacterium riegelii TaxID=156976 RepID=UPI00254F2FD0|nr:septum formation initiator family protein [Corynebacterium riegelii]MDK7180129.1 septum formation initiator family protein [Corynebacterium riegelii]
MTPDAPKPRRKRRAPKTVPVASRDRAQREQAEARKKRGRAKPLILQQDLASTGILIAVILTVLIAIAVPLRNYYEGRSEIARAQTSIEALQQRKDELETDIARYEDPVYVEQEARRRLGVLAEGETAWRIIDPRMTQNPTITSEETPDDREWHQFLWDSLREIPEVEAPEAEVSEEAPAETPMPEEAAPEGEPAPEDLPAPEAPEH